MTSSAREYRVAIVGGGVSGLTAAYTLLTEAKEQKIDLELWVFDSGSRLGGVIETQHKNRALLELGPDAIFSQKPGGKELCEKLGLQVEPTNAEMRQSFIALKGKLVPVPEGFYLLAPVKIFSFLTSSILSWRGKFRVLCEWFIRPSPTAGSDESLASFVRRRFGQELLDNIAQPMAAGVYSTPAEELSLESSFPLFLELEKEYGSVLRGLRARQKTQSNQATASASGPRYSLFFSLKGGMQKLIDALKAKLPNDSVRLNMRVEKIEIDKTGSASSFRVRSGNFDIRFDAVCLATNAGQAAHLLRSIDSTTAHWLEKIKSAPAITVNLLFSRKFIKHALDGFGFVVPKKERNLVSGVTFSSVKFPSRVSGDRVLLRAFIGGRDKEDILNRDDKAIENSVMAELRQWLGITVTPLACTVKRYPGSLPQYRVGHLETVRKIEERLSSIARLAVCGNFKYGSGVPECIRQGQEAAHKILRELTAL